MQNKSSKARRRGDGLSGALIFKTSRGQAVVQHWPKPMTQAQYLARKPHMDAFTIAQRNFHFLTTQELESWLSTTHQTPYLPRDLYTQHVFGRLWAVLIPGKGTIYPMTARRDASEGLDLLAQLPGQMLVRGADYWQPLPWGTNGQVLTSKGPNETPEWTAGGGGGGGGGWPYTAPQLSAFTQTVVPSIAEVNELLKGGIGTILENYSDGKNIVLTKPRDPAKNRLIVGVDMFTRYTRRGLVGIGVMDSTTGQAVLINLDKGGYDAYWSLSLTRWNDLTADNFGTEQWSGAQAISGAPFIGLEIDGTDYYGSIGNDPQNMQAGSTPLAGGAGNADTWVYLHRNTGSGNSWHGAQMFHWQEDSV